MNFDIKIKDLQLQIGFLKEENDRLEKNNKILKHKVDSTCGLWCIDRNPSLVSHEWIVKNAFQLTPIGE